MKYSSQGTRTGIAWRTFAKRNWEALLGAAGRAASGAMRGFVSLSVGKFARCSNVAHCRPSVRRTVIRLNSITRGCARVKVMTNGLGGEDLAAPAAEIEFGRWSNRPNQSPVYDVSRLALPSSWVLSSTSLQNGLIFPSPPEQTQRAEAGGEERNVSGISRFDRKEHIGAPII